MAEALLGVPTTQQQKSFWGSAVPRKKNATHFEEMQSQYQEFISGNDLLSVASVLERVATRTVSLLTADVKTRKLV